MVVRPFPPSFRMRSLKDPRSGDGPPPGALALLHDLMVCGTGESVSLGLHGSAAVAVRNRRSACSGGNMCQYHPRRSEWPAPDHLATRIAAKPPPRSPVAQSPAICPRVVLARTSMSRSAGNTRRGRLSGSGMKDGAGIAGWREWAP